MSQAEKYPRDKGKGPADIVGSSTSHAADPETTQQRGDDADTKEGFAQHMELRIITQPRRDHPFNEILTISVVPEHSRAIGNESRYKPYLVSIGPHHRDTARQREWVEKQKVSCVQYLLLASGKGTQEEGYWESVYEEVMQLQKHYRILECYRLDKNKKPNNRDLVDMLVHDACYLIAYFCKPDKERKTDPNWNELVRDTWYLLENQMPLMVVEKIGTLVANLEVEYVRSRFRHYAKVILHAQNYIWTEKKNQEPAGDSAAEEPNQELLGSGGCLQFKQLLGNKRKSKSSEPSGTPLQELNPGNGPATTQDGSPIRLGDYLRQKGDATNTDSTEKAGLLEPGSNKSTENNLGVRVAGSSNPEPASVRSGIESDDSPKHLLHMLHTLLTPKEAVQINKEPDPQHELDEQVSGARKTSRVPRCWHRATDYIWHSNVKLVSRPLDAVAARTVLDVGKQTGLMRMRVQIPCLHIDDNTWTLLVNLMALETQHGSRLGTHVTAYCMFLSQVACTVEDVKLLQSCDVISTSLGSPDKVAKKIRDLCDGVSFDVDDPTQNYLYPILVELEERYRCRWHNVVSWFRLNYWSTKKIAVLAGVISGIIVLVAGVFSAAYAYLQYKESVKTPTGAPSSFGHWSGRYQ